MAEKKVSSEKKVVATAGTYDVLLRPVISEKAAKLSESNNIESITKVHAIARSIPKIKKLPFIKDKTYRFYCFSKDINNKELLKQEGFIWNPFINSWFTKEFHKEKNIPKLRTYRYDKNKFILLEL